MLRLRFKVVLFYALLLLLPLGSHAQSIVLAGSYDGSHYELSAWEVGFVPYNTEFIGVGGKFRIDGTGEFTLTRATLAIASYNQPDSSKYQLSIVNDTGGVPGGEVVWSGVPQGIGTQMNNANVNFDLTGQVQGGRDYWMLFSPVAPDSGQYLWFFPSRLDTPTGSWHKHGPMADRALGSGMSSRMKFFLHSKSKALLSLNQALLQCSYAGWRLCSFCESAPGESGNDRIS